MHHYRPGLVFILFLQAIPSALGGATAEFPIATSGAAPGTRVQFVDGVRTLGVAVADQNGEARLSAGTLAPGSHVIHALEWGSGKQVGEALRLQVPARPAGTLPLAGITYGAGVQPAAAAFGDLSGDGFHDAILASSDGILVMSNHGGAFLPPVKVATVPGPTGIAVQDFNGDGRNDLAVTAADGRVAIFLNLGGGEFSGAQYFAVGAHPSAIVSADWNGDGIPDLAISNRDSNDISILTGKGDGTFQAAVAIPAGYSPRALAVADFNGDGAADLAVANFASNSVSIFLGDGKGGFKGAAPAAVGNGPISLAEADFNEDGSCDLAVLNQIDGSVLLLMNDGSGAFRAGVLIQDVTTSLAAGDVDGDGHVDLVAQSSGELRVRPGRGDGTFGAGYGVTTSVPAIAVRVGDFNRDGWMDVATVDGGGGLTVRSGALAAVTGVAPLDGMAATTTTLASSPNPSGFGQAVTLTATVSPATATGSVSFYDSATLLGTGNLSNGTATLEVTTMSLGSHSLLAIYGGDASDSPSASSFVTQMVAIATSTTLTSSVNPSAYGQSVMLTATVSPSTVTGLVTFYDGTTILGIERLAGGQAVLNTSLLPAGSRLLKAYYAGNATDAPSSSTALGQTVGAPTAQANGFRPLLTVAANCCFSAAVADFNLDGKADIASLTTTGVSLFPGNGDGTFQPPMSFTLSIGNHLSPVVGDFNGDGKADLAISGQNGVDVFLGNGNGTFRPAVTYPATLGTLTLGDFNGDGNTDILAPGAILFGNGDGTFQPAVSDGIASTAVGDFNGDGKADLAVPNGNTNASVYLGNGDGTFQSPVNYPASNNVTAIAVGDFNGDGKADLAIAVQGSGGVNILLGNGDGTFKPAVNYSAFYPSSLLVTDVNGDGKADLVIDSAMYGATFRLGNGDGTFQSQVTLAAFNPSSGTGLGVPTAADFNGDGRTDFVILNGAMGVLLGGQATQFKFSSQPVNSVAGTSLSVMVQVADSNGNSVILPAETSVTLTSNPPGIQATATTLNSAATFNNLVLTTAGTYTLSASGTGLNSTNSNSFTVSANTAAKMGFSTQPSNGVAGVALSPAVTVQVQDQYGNVVTGSNALVTVSSIPAGASATVSAQNGVATFSSLVLNTTGAYALVASSSGLTSGISNAFTIGAGMPSKLVFTGQPANILYGGTLPPVVVQVQDANGNVVTGSSASVTITSSPLGISAMVNAVNGVATFSGITVNTAGTYTLMASSNGLATAASYPFIAAPQNSFIVSGQVTVFGAGLSGVTITVTGSTNTSATTNPSGSYAVALGMNGTYLLAASLTGYTFSLPVSLSDLIANQTVNFAGASVSASKVGVFRDHVPTAPAFLEDSNGNGQYDAGVDPYITTFVPPGGAQAGDVGLSGDWTGNGHWKVGIFRPSTGQWWLDANNDGVFDSGDYAYTFGGLVSAGVAQDVPVVGDWGASGKTCIGVFRSGFVWLLDVNCNGTYDNGNSCNGISASCPDAFFPFGGLTGDVPVVEGWSGSQGSGTHVGIVRAYAPGGVVGACNATTNVGCPFFWVFDSAAANNVSGSAGTHVPATGAFPYGGLFGDLFATGDWQGNGQYRAGVYRQGIWLLDVNGSHTQQTFFGYGGLAGDSPLVGKW